MARGDEARGWEAPQPQRSRAPLALALLATVAVAALVVSGVVPGAGEPGGDGQLEVEQADGVEGGGIEGGGIDGGGIDGGGGGAGRIPRPGPLRRRLLLPPPTPVVPRPLPGTWTALAPPPGPPAARPRAVWTGEELVTPAGAGDGGSQLLAAFDPGTGAWTELQAPLPTDPASLLVWTGEAVVLLNRWGSVAWTPERGTWRLLPAAGAPPSPLAALWDGYEVLVWSQRAGGAHPAVHAYDQDTDGWRDAGSAALERLLPLGGGYARGRPVLWGMDLDARRPAVLVGHVRTDVGVPEGLAGPAVVTTGDGVFALGRRGRDVAGAVFTLGRGWEPLGSAPHLPGAVEARYVVDPIAPVWTGERVIFAVVGGSIGAYRPADGRWERIGTPAGLSLSAAPPALTWAGDHLLVLGRSAAGERGLYRWEPGD